MSAFADRLQQVYGLLQQGRTVEAGLALAPLLQEFPREPAVYRALATVQQMAGRHDDAVEAMRRAILMAPRDVNLQADLGQTLAAAGRTDEAIAAFSQAVALQPDFAAGWYLLGMTAYGVGRDREALDALRRAATLAPDHPQVLHALAETVFALERFAEALPLYERLAASAGAPDPGVELRCSQCLRRTGAPERALPLLEAALLRFPDYALLWLELGGVQEDLGAADDALAAYRRAHALAPEWGDPIGSAIALGREAAPEALVRTAETLAANPATPAPQRAFLHHALGKREDARGEHAAAANHWTQANRLRRDLQGGFDRDDYAAKIDAAIAAFTPEALQSRRDQALRDERPLFVLGMPRSGTTLVEQILAAHPQAFGCGERSGIVEIAQALPLETGVDWPQRLADVPADWLRRRAEAYLADAGDAAEGASRLVDKQPYNFEHVGLIAMLFADARIVWCRRDPRDVALSIFSESFSPQATYATDLDDIAFMIEQQARWMRHWQAVSPLPILELRYEDVVADTEAQIRRLVDFAGLPWDDRCLAFHASGRAVQTLSRWQVRQPVHARSVGRWRHYAPWFDAGVTASDT